MEKRRAGYAVVSNFAKPLPPGTSAQLAKLIALTRALELRKGKRVAIYTDSKYAFLVLHAHAAIWKERGHFKVSPIKYGDQILRLLRQSICQLRFQSPIAKDTKKGARQWPEGTKQPIRQLGEQHYNDLIQIPTLVPQTNLPKLLHILKVRHLKLRVRVFKKIIRGGSKRRNFFFCLGTSSRSWLTPYMPQLI